MAGASGTWCRTAGPRRPASLRRGSRGLLGAGRITGNGRTGSEVKALAAFLASTMVVLLAAGPAGAAAPGMAHVSGNAGHGGPSPDAGVQVELRELSGGAHEVEAYTDEAGNWDAGELPAGTYGVNHSVIHASGSGWSSESAGSGQVELGSGQDKVLHATLSGARPQGEIVVDIQGHGPPGSAVRSASVVMPGGGTQSTGFPGPDGRYRLFVPSGSYEVTGTGGGDDAPTTVPVSVLEGHEAATTCIFSRERSEGAFSSGPAQPPRRAAGSPSGYTPKGGPDCCE